VIIGWYQHLWHTYGVGNIHLDMAAVFLKMGPGNMAAVCKNERLGAGPAIEPFRRLGSGGSAIQTNRRHSDADRSGARLAQAADSRGIDGVGPRRVHQALASGQPVDGALWDQQKGPVVWDQVGHKFWRRS
jgi:hypothetical protein